MWSTTSILLVLLSIFGIINCYEFSSDGPHFRGIASSDDSESIVKTFLEKMTKTIETKDSGLLSDLFSDQFLFHGCKGDYDKKKVISILSQIPSGTTFSITLKSSKYLSTDQIEYFVTVSGFGIDQPIDARFVLCKSSGMLSGGSIPACKKTHVHSPRAFDSSDNVAVANDFLSKLLVAAKEKNGNDLVQFFSDDFNYQGCYGKKNKENVVSAFLRLPFKFDYIINSVQDTGNNLNISLTVNGVGPRTKHFEFLLSKEKKVLIGGRCPSCDQNNLYPARSLHSFASHTSQRAILIVENFLEKLVSSIELRDESIISDLFQPGFVFKGCNGVYEKKVIVELLSTLETGTKFSISLKSVDELGLTIRFLISAEGFGSNTIIGEFILNRSDHQLETGYVPGCQYSRKHGFISQDSAQMTIEKFLKRMISSIESQDESIISGLFEPGFILKGCKGIYDKTKIVSLLTQIPAGSKFNFALKSVEDRGSSIKYLVSASGFDKTDVNIEFVLNKNDQQLESGSVPECQKSRGFVSQDFVQAVNSDDVINVFLSH